MNIAMVIGLAGLLCGCPVISGDQVNLKTLVGEDEDGDGYRSEIDCNDKRDDIHPDQVETCDGVDNNCDGVVDEDGAEDAFTFYRDSDQDGFGDGSVVLEPCDPAIPSGYVSDGTDCDDQDPNTYVGAAATDSGTACMTDADGDGYGSMTPGSGVTAGTDCDDGAASVNPSAAEVCDANDVDEDCDGLADDNDTDGASGATDYYTDADGDGYGDEDAAAVPYCDPPSTGVSTNNDDCDDNDSGTVNDMDCDGSLKDDDCDDSDPEFFPWDSDGDGVNETCGWFVSAGGDHTCGVRSNGSLECWGRNIYNQITDTPFGTFQSVSAGNTHNCGVTTTGSVACWGGDSYNQVTDTPSSTFQSVSAGGYHTCGVTTSGSVECWGCGSTDCSEWEGQSSPHAGDFQSVSAGGYHTCGVTTSGSVECWGKDTDGQSTPPSGSFLSVSAGRYHTCGVVTTSGIVECWGKDTDGSITPPAGTFQSVSAGDYHNCGVTTSGSVTCWGWDYLDQSTPPAGTFQSVSAGEYHTCGVTTGGSVACWGDNSFNQSTPP
jgi:hypothetical protein